MTNETLLDITLRTEQSFLRQNIEKFLSGYTTIEDIEIMAISACWLNVGIRNEGVSYAQWAYNRFKSGGGPLQYVIGKEEWPRFRKLYTKFTEKHSLNDWYSLMKCLHGIYSNGSTILAEVMKRISYNDSTDFRDDVLLALVEIFDGVRLMPTFNDFIPNKFVRFVMMMVRPRPIDTGIWSDAEPELFGQSKTYIPLNSELVKTISDTGLLESPSMTWNFAKTLAEYFSDMFPGDPGRGYFSLIGLNNYK